MKTTILIAVFAVSALLASPATAYSLRNETDQGECVADGSTCDVFCDSGSLAGSMNWNGSVWTDGVKWDEDQDTEAQNICAANGSDCT
jgi:hypothetical protein